MTESFGASTLDLMSTIEVPDEIAAALAAAAREGGVTIAQLLADFVTGSDTDELDAFVGIGASGRTEPFDIRAEREALAAKRDASSI